MGIKRERIANFNVQRPVNWDEKAVQKIIDREGFVYVDIKYDGIRGVVYFDTDIARWRIVTRENIEIVSISERVHNLLTSAGVVHDAVLDCEVVIPEIPFDKASGLLRGYTPLSFNHDLELYVFDNLKLDALTLKSRSAQIINRGDFNLEFDTLTVVKRRRAADLADIDFLFEGAKEEGFEGVVVKDPGQKYTGSKVKGWFKLKPKETQDGTIIDFVHGTVGKANEGLVVGFVVKLEDGTTCNATGLTQDLMHQVTMNHGAYLYRYVEVERMESTGEGNSRHPHFKRFRDLDHAKGVKA